LEGGIDPQLLDQAIEAAIAGETKAPRDLVKNHYQTPSRQHPASASTPLVAVSP
jgi:hypothetical protein